MTSRGCWFLFQHYFPEFRKLNSYLGKFWPKQSKFSILLEKWDTWYLSISKINPFLGKFRPKNSKCSILTEKWQTLYLEDANPYPDISFLNFQAEIPFWANKFWSKKSKLFFCLKIGTHTCIHIHTNSPPRTPSPPHKHTHAKRDSTSKILILISVLVSQISHLNLQDADSYSRLVF